MEKELPTTGPIRESLGDKLRNEERLRDARIESLEIILGNVKKAIRDEARHSKEAMITLVKDDAVANGERPYHDELLRAYEMISIKYHIDTP